VTYSSAGAELAVGTNLSRGEVVPHPDPDRERIRSRIVLELKAGLRLNGDVLKERLGMNIKRSPLKLSCALVVITLLAQVRVGAILIDFNSAPVGSVADGAYGDVSIRTLSTITENETQEIIGYGHGTIRTDYGSPNVSVNRIFPSPGYTGGGVMNRVQLDVEFLRPISEFSVNVNSDYSSMLFYTVRTDAGYETKSIWFGAIHSYDYHTLQVTAPEGGYLTSFYFSQADRGGVEVVMDNLNYTVAAHVPDTMGTLSGLAIALTCIGVVRYRFSAAKIGPSPIAS
jgi:hypothetical protein